MFSFIKKYLPVATKKKDGFTEKEILAIADGAQNVAVQIALLLLNAQRLTVPANYFELQLKQFNKDFAAKGGKGEFAIDNGSVIFKPQNKKQDGN